MATSRHEKSFLHLAVELRLKIYAYVYQDLTYSDSTRIDPKEQAYRFRGPLALLQCNRQVREEALPIFRNNLTLRCWNSYSKKRNHQAFVFENATKLVHPVLDLCDLRYHVARMPSILFVELAVFGVLGVDTPVIKNKEDLAASLRGRDDDSNLTHALTFHEYNDLQNPITNSSGAHCDVHISYRIGLRHEYVNIDSALRQLYYLKIDVFRRTVIERNIRFDSDGQEFYVAAKEVFLLLEGLPCPVLYYPRERRYRYITLDRDIEQDAKQKLEDRTTFDRAFQGASRCG